MNRVVIMSYMVSAGAQSSTTTTRCFRRVNTDKYQRCYVYATISGIRKRSP